MTLAHDEQYCASCGEAIKKAAQRCPECGVPDGVGASRGQTEFCVSCGEQVKSQAEVCPNCGVRHNQSDNGEISASDVQDGLYYAQIVLGAMALLSAIGALSSPDSGFLISLLTSFFLGGVGLLLLPPVRDKFEKRHPVTTFGRIQNIREIDVSNSNNVCSVCNEKATDVVKREYGTEFVIAGYTLSSETEGSNVYCQPCREVEITLEQSDDSLSSEMSGKY